MVMLPFGGIVRYHMAEVNCTARELPPPGRGLGWAAAGGRRLAWAVFEEMTGDWQLQERGASRGFVGFASGR